jgi:DNA-binding transcriptional ArsR family regulator
LNDGTLAKLTDIAFDVAARCMAELGHPHRLQIFQLLVKAGEGGLAVGEIQKQVGIPKSTLAHHIAQLVATGLMTQERQGRIQRCRIAPERARALVTFFVNDCCEGLPGIEGLFD